MRADFRRRLCVDNDDNDRRNRRMGTDYANVDGALFLANLFGATKKELHSYLRAQPVTWLDHFRLDRIVHMGADQGLAAC